MKLRTLIVDEQAVSSTLGIVLLVAVTVILAAIFGAFAFGLLGTEAAPNTEFDYTFSNSGQDVVVRHDGGDRLNVDKMSFGDGWGDDPAGSNQCQFVPDDADSGDIVIDDDGNAGNGADPCTHNAGAGTDLSLVWESNDGKTFIIDERSRSA